jgi:hypothetical protein
VIGTLGGNIENALNTVTLPIRKGIAGIGASAIINGSILQQSAAGLIGNIANSGVGQAVGNTLSGVSSVLSSGAGLLGSIWGPIAGGFGSLLAGAAPVVAAISGIIAVVSILGDHLEDIRGIVGNVFGDTGLAIFDAFADKLGGIADFITGLFSDGGVANALAPLRDGFSNLLADGGFLSTIFGGQGNGLAAFDGVVQILQSILGVAGQVVTFATETMKPIFQDIFSFITETVVPIVLQTFESAAPAISNIVSGLGSAVMTGMQIIGTAIQTALPIIEGVIATILSIGSVAIPAVLSAFGVFSQGIADIMADIQQIFGGLISFVTGVFTGDWSKAWNGIKDVFGGAFNALVDLCKTPINAVISIINSAISHINKLGITIPDWVPTLGGKNFSINIPKIPMLANGGFTAGPSIAGEAGQEAVISFKPSERARNVSLWEQAGDLLGVNRIKLDEIERDDRGWNGNSDGSGITFAPQITIQGNADTAVMQEAITEMRSQFETWYEEMQRRKLRTAY